MSPGRPRVLGPGPVLDTFGFPRASLVTREKGVSLAMTSTESSLLIQQALDAREREE